MTKRFVFHVALPLLTLAAALPMSVQAGPASLGSPGPFSTVAVAVAAETRLQGAAILQNPIGDLALRYADLLHAGKMDDAMKLASTTAQAGWKALPASERTASADFRRKLIPPRAALAAGIRAGGVLIIEGDSRATLNVVTVEQKSPKPGVVESSSGTIAIPFVQEGGQWKLAQ
jgi:hypothetical protein